MSDTKPHAHPGDPVEHDAISFGALFWFVVILAATVAASQLIVWGLFEWMDYRVGRADTPRVATAAAPASPAIADGRIETGTEAAPEPRLLVAEPTVLREFFETERREQREYGWVDQAMGVVRLPIEHAKALVLERGLPVHEPGTAAGAGTAGTTAGADAGDAATADAGAAAAGAAGE